MRKKLFTASVSPEAPSSKSHPSDENICDSSTQSPIGLQNGTCEKGTEKTQRQAPKGSRRTILGHQKEGNNEEFSSPNSNGDNKQEEERSVAKIKAPFESFTLFTQQPKGGEEPLPLLPSTAANKGEGLHVHLHFGCASSSLMSSPSVLLPVASLSPTATYLEADSKQKRLLATVKVELTGDFGLGSEFVNKPKAQEGDADDIGEGKGEGQEEEGDNAKDAEDLKGEEKKEDPETEAERDRLQARLDKNCFGFALSTPDGAIIDYSKDLEKVPNIFVGNDGKEYRQFAVVKIEKREVISTSIKQAFGLSASGKGVAAARDSAGGANGARDASTHHVPTSDPQAPTVSVTGSAVSNSHPRGSSLPSASTLPQSSIPAALPLSTSHLTQETSSLDSPISSSGAGATSPLAPQTAFVPLALASCVLCDRKLSPSPTTSLEVLTKHSHSRSHKRQLSSLYTTRPYPISSTLALLFQQEDARVAQAESEARHFREMHDVHRYGSALEYGYAHWDSHSVDGADLCDSGHPSKEGNVGSRRETDGAQASAKEEWAAKIIQRQAKRLLKRKRERERKAKSREQLWAEMLSDLCKDCTEKIKCSHHAQMLEQAEEERHT